MTFWKGDGRSQRYEESRRGNFEDKGRNGRGRGGNVDLGNRGQGRRWRVLVSSMKGTWGTSRI